ncbi:MAG TPA: protein-disulfide reductase DsbD [Gammaproteobacteria bacterium]|nr:protein-disulfide reductase DsbD [Gammaproteobacteria bacterium]
MSSLQFAARLLTACFALSAGSAVLAQQDQPPPAEEVFLYKASADAERVYLDFDIRDGYYAYRTRFGFDSGTNGVALGAARFPNGEIHSDEFFGEQQVYRHQFQVAIPYRRSAARESFELKLELQGCADFGLCYLPQEWTANVTLPPPAFLGAGSIDTTATGDLLPVDDAFTMNARFDKPNELTVAWQIAPGYYLYRDKLTTTVNGPIELGAANLPKGVAHTDDNFGDVEVFFDYVEVKVPFARASPDAIDVELTAGFQGCKEGSICYPPGEQLMSLVLPATSEFPAPAAAGGDELVSEQDQWAARIVNGTWPELLGWFYLGGLLLSFTPCVLPMVPILSSIIAGQGTVSTSRGFALSVSYVLGMAFTYTILGAASALAGQQLQAALQEPWILSAFAGVFVVLALGLFGAFQFQMPTTIQTRLSNLANQQKAGTFAGTAVIGALTSLIMTTCVAPVLVGALVVIGQTGDVTRGAGALFAMSIGMGSPLLLVGASAGYLLPKVGPWMDTVKAGFGVIMLGFAIYLLGRFLPPTPTLFLWAVLVFFTGVFIGAFDTLPPSPAAWRRVAKGIGVLVCVYGILLFIGASLGGGNLLQPIPRAALTSGSTGGALASLDDEEALEFRSIATVAQLDAALAEARAANRPVMLDFTAEWCISCKEMEEYTFPDSGVIGALEPFLLLRADVTDNDDDDKALLQRFKSFGPPTIAFFDRSGFERSNFKLVGFVPAEKFSEHVQSLAAL